MTQQITCPKTDLLDERRKKKIIYVQPHPPTVDFGCKYFVKQFQENNFDTEYWDMGPLLGYDMKFPADFNGLNYIKILNLRELTVRLEAEEWANVVFVLQLFQTLQSFPIYFLFSRLNKKTVFFGRGYLPALEHSKKGLFYYIRMIFNVKNIKAQFLSRSHRALNKIFPAIKKYDVVFVAGNLAERVHVKDAVKISRIHHYDIDFSNADEESPADVPGDYFVFLDEYLPFHPDFGGAENRINPATYYASLNSYFDRIEKKYRIRFVIAAHPKASYRNNPFDNRTIIFNKSNALVKNAKCVFTHASTAVSFAVIHEKPLYLVHSDEIRKIHPHLYNQMIKTSEILGCAIQNFEAANDESLEIFGVDKMKYMNYYTEFLSSGVATGNTFPIVFEEINLLLDQDRLPSDQNKVPA
jgi:hypothetical protein